MTVVFGVISVMTNVVITAFFYGRLSQQVSNLREDHKKMDRERRDQWTDINNLRVEVGKLQRQPRNAHGD